ncbi:MAG: GNAT family N-acetyltransferase [Proteobacteria bacterium]|nr:GNAT family N-acetyltransferase [Pseudomonadota bacterium]
MDAFLAQYAGSSMFLRSNCHRHGLADFGLPLQGTWLAKVNMGEIVGVVCHSRRGTILLQAPDDVEVLAIAVAEHTKREVKGLIGPWEQSCKARHALGKDQADTSLDSCEDLFEILLDDLIVPSKLAKGEITVRHATAADQPLLLKWQFAYEQALFGDQATPDGARETFESFLSQNALWVATREGDPVSQSAFNAQLPDCVQVGGVFTPPKLRGHGYARCAVAGSLLEARNQGVKRSILFTAKDNTPARRAYVSLGYKIIGDFGLTFFR